MFILWMLANDVDVAATDLISQVRGGICEAGADIPGTADADFGRIQPFAANLNVPLDGRNHFVITKVARTDTAAPLTVDAFARLASDIWGDGQTTIEGEQQVSDAEAAEINAIWGAGTDEVAAAQQVSDAEAAAINAKWPVPESAVVSDEAADARWGNAA